MLFRKNYTTFQWPKHYNLKTEIVQINYKNQDPTLCFLQNTFKYIKFESNR